MTGLFSDTETVIPGNGPPALAPKPSQNIMKELDFSLILDGIPANVLGQQGQPLVQEPGIGAISDGISHSP